MSVISSIFQPPPDFLRDRSSVWPSNVPPDIATAAAACEPLTFTSATATERGSFEVSLASASQASTALLPFSKLVCSTNLRLSSRVQSPGSSLRTASWMTEVTESVSASPVPPPQELSATVARAAATRAGARISRPPRSARPPGRPPDGAARRGAPALRAELGDPRGASPLAVAAVEPPFEVGYALRERLDRVGDRVGKMDPVRVWA